MQVLHQSDLAMSHDSQKMNHLRTKLSQKHSCTANDRVAQIEILLVCPLIDDKKLANKHARNNSVIVKIHIFHVNLLQQQQQQQQQQQNKNIRQLTF